MRCVNKRLSQFQDALGGPTAEVVSLINADLVCQNGVWTYTEEGITNDITQVNCALGFVEDQSCTSCTPGSIQFTPASGAGTSDSTYRGPDTDANGCLTLTAVCPASANGGTVFMQFNEVIGGPLDVGVAEVTAVLQCVNGAWEYTGEDGTTTVITEVNCLAT